MTFTNWLGPALILGVAALCGSCKVVDSLGMGSKSVTYENFYLAGQSGFSLPAETDEAVASEIEQRLTGLLLFNYLTAHFPDTPVTTKLHAGDVLPLRRGNDNYPDYVPDPYAGWYYRDSFPDFNASLLDDTQGGGRLVPGTQSISDDMVALDFSLAPLSDGLSELQFSGEFDRRACQSAIDEAGRFPIRREEYTKSGVVPGVGRDVTSTQEFTIHWTVSGSLDGQAFSVPLEQQFRVRRVRFGQSTGPS